MTAAGLHCADPSRRRRAARARDLNGIDFVDLDDDRRVLTVAFLEKAPESVGRENVRIDGGRRVRDLRVVDIRIRRDRARDRDDWMRITLDKPGDASTYTLRLVEPDDRGRPGTEPMRGFDRRYAALDFSFAAGCESGLDCLPDVPCPPPSFPEPAISYLARDYASFRRLILDRMALVMPGWTERHLPDLELTLVELLAYVGDYLSYYQDAVATEMYLDTARRRISVRRHLRLIDYRLHEGNNARAWVVVSVARDVTLQPGDYRFVTAPAPVRGEPVALRATEVAALEPGSYEVFEPIDNGPVALRAAHNSIDVWTWGEDECCIDAGATRATLVDGQVGPEGEHRRVLDLSPGDVIVFEEVVGPRTGSPADADATHRQAVRLTAVTPGFDDVFGQPVREVEWAEEDALCFPLCLSSVSWHCRPLLGVSVARGNVVLVDHGARIGWCDGAPEPVKVPPAPPAEPDCDPCAPPLEPRGLEGELERMASSRDPFPVPFTVALARGPVTHRAPFPPCGQIARGQARRLEEIEGRARRWVEDLRERAAGGHPLGDARLAGLRRLLGAERVADADLEDEPERAERGLGSLLADWDRLLARKRRRLAVLARRARAGAVLGADEADEIAETWGLAYAAGIDPPGAVFDGPACAATEQDPHEALAQLDLRAAGDGGAPWEVRADLLGSEPTDRHVVVEVDDEGLAHLRFGDGDSGRAVDPDTTLIADYRVGNGTAGNVGAEAISRIVLCETDQAAITAVRNPLPACGGTDPEPVQRARLLAPLAIKSRLERAVTAADYATLAGRVPGVQRAAAHLSWTGSWYVADVALDPLGTEELAPELCRQVAEELHRYRRIGHDLRVGPAEYVPIDLSLRICVAPRVARGAVERHVRDALRAFFHPDELTFGDDVALSRVVAVVQALPGVESVEVLRFERLGVGDRGELASGALALGPLEVARLDNDPVRPENGTLTLELRGGR